MDKQYIESEFDRFFDFPSEDKSQVSSVSAKLFAEHIAYPIEDDLKRTQRNYRLSEETNAEIILKQSEEISVLRANNTSLCDQRFNLMEEIEELKAIKNILTASEVSDIGYESFVQLGKENDELRAALVDLMTRYESLFDLYVRPTYNEPSNPNTDLELALTRCKEALGK